MKRIKKYRYEILLIFIALITMTILLWDSTLQGHDTNFHLANIENMKSQIRWNHFIPTEPIVPNLSDKMGYGLYIFYPILPHLVTAHVANITGWFGIDTMTSLNIVYILISVISTLLIYHLSFRLSKNKTVAFASGIIFLLMPYRIGLMTVRGALNESFVTIFFPMILLSLLYFKEKEYCKFYLFFIVGWVGIILSHLTMALFSAFFFLPFLLCFREEIKEKSSRKKVYQAILFVAILVLPNIVLALSQNGYLVYQDGYMTSLGLIKDNLLSFRDYLIPSKNYDWTVPYFIPCVTLLCLGISTFLFAQKKEKQPFYLVMMCLLPILVFLMSFGWIWDILPQSLYMIQFPWRLLSILGIFISLIAPYLFISDSWKKGMPIILIVLFLSLISFFNHVTTRPYHIFEIDMEKGRGNINEYYPVEYLKYPLSFEENEEEIVTYQDDCSVTFVSNQPGDVTIQVKSKDMCKIELPMIYYEGYVIEKIPHQSQPVLRSREGKVMVEVKESGKYHIYFRGTTPYIFFKSIRTITILCSIFNLIFFAMRRKHDILKKER